MESEVILPMADDVGGDERTYLTDILGKLLLTYLTRLGSDGLLQGST